MKVTTLLFNYRGKEDIKFRYDVNVSKDGVFSTTLSKDVVAMLESYGVVLGSNRLGNHGYFSAPTMEGLERMICEVVEEAVSCELVGIEDVIKYQILISASYCKNRVDESEKSLYPNGALLNGNYQWIEGNVRSDGLNQHPACFSVYVKPVSIKRYRYKSGRERIEEGNIDERKYTEGGAVRFINSIVNVFPNKYVGIEQMPCTEENAEFFKTAIMSIWKLNESLGEILRNGTLELAIKSRNILLD